MIQSKPTVLALIFVLLFSQWCSRATNFAKQAVAILNTYPELLSSLNLPVDLNSALVVDFKELTVGATTMSDAFAAIAPDDPQSRPKHLAAVNAFSTTADTVFARGNFDTRPALSKVKLALKGLIVAAKIYYSPIFGASPAQVKAQRNKQEQDLKAKLKELKAAMKP